MATCTVVQFQELIVANATTSDLAPLLAGARLPYQPLTQVDAPLRAISSALLEAGRAGHPVSTLHIVAHGRPGGLLLGGRWIDREDLINASEELAQWNVKTVALWACQTGSDPSFLATFSELTGAQILASSTILSHEQGLHLAQGSPNQRHLSDLFEPAAIQQWHGSLQNEYDTSGNQLDFSFSKAQLINGGLNSLSQYYTIGTEFRFQNVITVKDALNRDVVIDAIISYTGGNRAWLTTFDNSNNQYSANPTYATSTNPLNFARYDAAAELYFQPSLRILADDGSGEAFADFTIKFVENYASSSDRGQSVLLKNVNIDFYDIDGNGANASARQFVEADVVSNYTIASGTSLGVTSGVDNNGDGLKEGIRFTALNGTNILEKPGTIAGDQIRARVDFATGISEMKFQIGDSGWSDPVNSANAYYAINIGTQRTFTNPVQFGLKANTVTVAECGSSAVITVCLLAPETFQGNPFTIQDDVTVNLVDLLGGPLSGMVLQTDGNYVYGNELIFSATQLTFSASNWRNPQTITVTGINDNLPDGNFNFKGLLKATSSNAYLNNTSTILSINNLDNDTFITPATASLISSDPYAYFTITAAAGRILCFAAEDALVNGTNGMAAATVEYSYDGITWMTCTAPGMQVSGTGSVSFQARVSLAPVADDGFFSGSKAFNLKVISPGVPCPTQASAIVRSLAVISGYVFEDSNDDGNRDPGEAGISGVTITLTGTDDLGQAVLRTLQTDLNGAYIFETLRPGTYYITQSQPTAYCDGKDKAGSTPGSSAGKDINGNDLIGPIVVNLGDSSTENNFGELKPDSISGTVFVDANNNGIHDIGEVGIADVTITLTGTDDAGNSVSRTVQTSAYGTYSFDKLARGTYSVTETQPANYLDGKDSIGNSGGTLSPDKVSAIVLTSGSVVSNINFGELVPASIRGTVFADTNNDGNKDPGESGIGGITITLKGTDDLGNAIEITATTDASGNYSFSGLRPGTYSVTETQPANYLDGKDSIGNSGGTLSPDKVSAIVLTSGSVVSNVNFGELLPASIGDRLWVDTNGNGLQDSGETGLSGRTVTLISGGGDGLLSTTSDNTSSSTTTGSDGIYGFTNLTPGQYRVQFGDKPSGTVFTTADVGTNDAIDSDADQTGLSPVITLVSGQTNNTVDAGVYTPVSLGDFIWEDANANGIQDGTETGIAGVTVYLTDASSNRVLASGNPISTTTDSSGAYSFSGLKPGSYGIEVVKPTGYVFSAKDQGSDDGFDSDVDRTTGKSAAVTLLSGQSTTNLDAGLYRTASLGDTVWHDLNANGIQDSGETGIAGATVYLLDGNGNRISQGGVPISTTTNASGKYSFSGLTPGYYAVEVVKPTGYAVFSSKGQGADTALDSNIDPTTGKSDVVELVSGEVETTLDAGLFNYASVGDRIWSDTNANGIQDSGETGAAGLSVELWDANGASLLATTTTNASGNYSFNQLLPGDYSVKFSKPADAYFSNTGAGTTTTDSDAGIDGFTASFTLSSGENNTSIDAGFNKLGSIGDFVWHDLNGNGIQDAGEPGLQGVAVSLLNEKGDTVLATTSTDAYGYYNFSGLKAAKYQVQFTKPTDFVFTDRNIGGNDLTDSDADPNNSRTGAITVNSGQAVTTVDAGFYKLATIGDRVWVDTNSNGIQNTGELGRSGVAVNLSGTDGRGTSVSLNTTTDANGLYTFNVRPGTYSVKVTLPTNFVASLRGTNPSSATDSNIYANGTTDAVTLSSGESNLTIDAGIFQGNTTLPSDLEITKTDGLTAVVAGQQITYTIVARNNSSASVSNVLVSDVIPANLTNATWKITGTNGSITRANATITTGSGSISDTLSSMAAGSSITYAVTGTVVKPGVNVSSTTTLFNLAAASDSAKTGTAGNSRSFTSNGVTLTARGYSREALSCGSVSWLNAYLGQYTTGLGLTNSGETSTDFRLDNVGSKRDYLVLQFSESVAIDKAALKAVYGDSDASFWFGNTTTLTSLSDVTLSALGTLEQNAGSSTDRTADINAGLITANTLVIAGASTESCGNDTFNVANLEVFKLFTSGSTLSNTATISSNGLVETNTTNNSATDTDTILSAPGVRTPGFWVNKCWTSFWDGIAGNEPSQAGTANFPKSDLFLAPYTNSPGSVTVNGKSVLAVRDPVTGTNTPGILVGDWNRNGCTDNGEQTVFYATTEALKVMDSSQQPDKGDVRYTLARSLVASWLNYMAGNPVDTASTSDKDARVWINQGITWLQTYTPDENKDGKGDGILSKLSTVSSPYMKSSNTAWSNTTSGGSVINTNLDNYNNGKGGLADGIFYGGSI